MSVYIVRPFWVVAPERVKRLALHMDFDDAFVAYLNGVEFSRENIGTPGIPPAYYEGADNWREAEIIPGNRPLRHPKAIKGYIPILRSVHQESLLC